MYIANQRFITIHTYLFAIAATVYLVGIFGTKVLQPGIVLAMGACILNLFFLDRLTRRIRLAALVWLVPLAVTGLFWQAPITARTDAPIMFYNAFATLLCLVPFLLLITGKPSDESPPAKRSAIVMVRIFFQTTLFMAYLALTAIAWIHGSRIDLVYWALFHILATALLPFLVGRALCGWICPNATIQDALYRHLHFPRPIARLPKAIEAQSSTSAMHLDGSPDTSATYLPVTLLLAWFVVFVFETVFDATQIKAYSIFFMYGVIALSFLFPWRKLCTHFCWIAGYKALAGHLSLWRIRYNRAHCEKCDTCNAEKACPFFIDIRNQQSEMPASCCLCFECRDACQSDNAITFKWVEKPKAPSLET
ncbi:MAG: 4Fe-4S binding protein [Proteobacteria bacterium]|nr:4Fe-4S binding protein [Pseudomonadota bacterium]